LTAQGFISDALCEEREDFVMGYGNLLAIAKTEVATYLYGTAGLKWALKTGIFRWTGERCPEAFTLVSDSFTDWLATMVRTSNPKYPGKICDNN
jgi:hypothetical protein